MYIMYIQAAIDKFACYQNMIHRSNYHRISKKEFAFYLCVMYIHINVCTGWLSESTYVLYSKYSS